MNNIALLTAFGSVMAFLFGVWKYLDTRKIEAQNKRFEQFRLISIWASGRNESGQILTEVHQAVAFYQLTEFPEYAYISLPIIDYFIERTSHEDGAAFLRAALTNARKRLEGPK